MKIGSKEYAQVSDRLKLFREENAKGVIETSFTELDAHIFILKATVTKDNGSLATGQALGKLDQGKAFEKLETIAVGRALAMLGYLASGQIASSEEMQEFQDYKQTKAEDAIIELQKATTLEELKQAYKSLGSLMSDETVIAAKDELKTKLK